MSSVEQKYQGSYQSVKKHSQQKKDSLSQKNSKAFGAFNKSAIFWCDIKLFKVSEVQKTFVHRIIKI